MLTLFRLLLDPVVIKGRIPSCYDSDNDFWLTLSKLAGEVPISLYSAQLSSEDFGASDKTVLPFPFSAAICLPRDFVFRVMLLDVKTEMVLWGRFFLRPGLGYASFLCTGLLLAGLFLLNGCSVSLLGFISTELKQNTVFFIG